MLFQDDALLPWKTARDNVALGLEFHRCTRKSALVQADYWLDRLGLYGFEHRYPRHLSGGQRKRVALAQVLALMPKLLLMDEPFASLDAIVRARIVQDVASLVEEEGISVLLVTHDLEEAISLSDRVYLLSQGPRARITQQYEVPIPRPRDPVKARVHPAFGPLYEKLWNDLSREVAFEQRGGGGVTWLDPRWTWLRQLAAFSFLLLLWETAGRAGVDQSAVRAFSQRHRLGALGAVRRRSRSGPTSTPPSARHCSGSRSAFSSASCSVSLPRCCLRLRSCSNR